MYYYIRISTRSNPSHDETRLGMSREEALKKFVLPNLRGEDLFIAGRFIKANDVVRIRVSSSKYSPDQLRGVVDAEQARSLVVTMVPTEWYIADKATDCTEEMYEEAREMSGEMSVSDATVAVPANAATVFVVHGRNKKARDSIYDFLRALGLQPLEWEEVLAQTSEEKGDNSPYVGDVVRMGLTMAAVTLVVMTGDDWAALREELLDEGEPQEYRPQPRPNVLFEAGWAMGHAPMRTVVVEIGALRGLSDLHGRHFVRLDNSAKARTKLKLRLESAGCKISPHKTDWLDAGDFEGCVVDGPSPELGAKSVARGSDELSKAARELLVLAYSDDGSIAISRAWDGTRYAWVPKQALLYTDADATQEYIYAVRELVRRVYLFDIGASEVRAEYTLTTDGEEMADRLRRGGQQAPPPADHPEVKSRGDSSGAEFEARNRI